ncbi:MAG: fluoride efflux transporter CrcB [Desulfovibrionaceae bacterium]|nr:fluoride efflux transporter CrcB [Desulfovibrionaceae bacterium]
MNGMSILMVAAGGALGAYCRYALGRWADRGPGTRFPCGTLLANVLGCFLMGLTAAAISRGLLAAAPWRDLIADGFLGALTTFSTFSMDTFRAMHKGRIFTGVINLVVSLVLCLTGVALGYRLLA